MFAWEERGCIAMPLYSVSPEAENEIMMNCEQEMQKAHFDVRLENEARMALLLALGSEILHIQRELDSFSRLRDAA